MRVRRALCAVLASGLAGIAGCGGPTPVARPPVLDRAGADVLVAAGSATVPGSVHVTAHPSRPPVAPARPLGTVGAAPGVPRPLPTGAIALTFDDGPDPRWTPQVLAVLARFHARATFFDIGVHAQAYPGLVRAEYAQGHGVGNHTWTHPDLTTLTGPQVADQIDRTAAVLRAETGHTPLCLRPPYDAIDPAVETVTAEQHEALMLYDVDPQDWRQPGVAAIVARVLGAARPGAVVDLHDAGGDRAQTVAALPLILAGLQARHLVTVPICRA